MFCVYVLYSSSLKKYYVGSTNVVQIRLEQHNAGRSNFTSRGTPWILVVTIECKSRVEAVRLESKIKKRGIGRYLSDNNLL